MEVMTPHSDSTDKVIDRRIFSGNADYTDHLERCYYALQARYDALEAEYMSLSQDDGKVERAYEAIKERYDALLRRDTDNLKRLIATHARYDALKAAAELMAKFINRNHIDDGSQRVLDVYDAATGEGQL